MVYPVSESRTVAVAAATVGMFLGSQAHADSLPGRSPYGTLVKETLPTAPGAEMAPLVEGLMKRGQAAGVGIRTGTPTPAAAPEASRAAAGPTAEVVFAAPMFPDKRGGRGSGTFASEPPAGLPADIVFAAPSRGSSMLDLSGTKPDRPSGEVAPASAAVVTHAAPRAATNGERPSRATPAQVAELKRQAREQLTTGSIAASRALLAEAVAGGDAEAQYMLARTFDPVALAQDGVIGVAADPARAADLYRLARVGGYPVPDQLAEQRALDRSLPAPPSSGP